MRVLVLGGYGLIGADICRCLVVAGHHVTGLGRATATARRQMPAVDWVEADIAGLAAPKDWLAMLERIRPDAIVNCAGALQDGARDRLVAVQETAMLALYPAAVQAGVRQLVQISAPRASADASTSFMRTKGKADAALAQSALEWTVLRPGLVLAPQAYGGTALLRALAATPYCLPMALAGRPVRTVAVGDVARAVESVLSGKVPGRQTYDLVEDEAHALADCLRAMRGWLGLPPGLEVAVPETLVRLAARGADALGWLGWRSPMRTTAIEELKAGVEGDPRPWRQATGRSLSSLQQSLAAAPATVQERWFARLFFLKPMAIGTLSAFWLVTGLITLANPAAARQVLTASGASEAFASAIVYAGSFADMVLGIAILFRRWMPVAALGMIALTLAYLIGGTIMTPGLWADPLGPLVKAVPAMMLALMALALAPDR
ncbi:MAG: SDR family oxidoreductase [Hyphomicrobiales bacterium]|nr:SDR family oxidoreductase [Hyphomicrobiales bacterium]